MDLTAKSSAQHYKAAARGIGGGAVISITLEA